jgi:Ser/Thr protein kinase RdoA (MazF antagonist)
MCGVLTAVASRFGLGDVIACAPITEGLMNPNWRLTTTAGTFAVKQLRDVTPAAARRQHAVLPLLAARGVPVPEVIGGVAEIDGQFYTVTRWITGTHRAGSELSLAACRSLGDLMARIHLGLADAMPEPAPLTRNDRPRGVDEARADLTRFGRVAAGHGDFGRLPVPGRLAVADFDRLAVADFDRLAVADIGRRLRLLDEVGHDRPPDGPGLGPVGWTHGDLNGLNLLFDPADERTVSGVLDWDRLAVRPYGLEVVRTATLLFDVGDLRRTAALAAGYRARLPISDAALRDAAHRRWWDLVTETWILRLHYDRGDPSCDHILPRSAALRRWWTAHRDEFDRALAGRP